MRLIGKCLRLVFPSIMNDPEQAGFDRVQRAVADGTPAGSSAPNKADGHGELHLTRSALESARLGNLGGCGDRIEHLREATPRNDGGPFGLFVKRDHGERFETAQSPAEGNEGRSDSVLTESRTSSSI